MQAAAAAALSVAPFVIPNCSPSKNFSQLVSPAPRNGCSLASTRPDLSIKATATTLTLPLLTTALCSQACETIGGDACQADIYPEVKLQPDARNDSPRSATELLDREYLEYNDAKTVFCAEACDDLGGEFCSREYQRGVY